jgi:hypothetical protein
VVRFSGAMRPLRRPLVFVGLLLAAGCARGDARPRAPSKPVDAPVAPGDGSLSKEAIVKVVRVHLPGIKDCYERELTKGTVSSGRADVSWTVEPDGHVSAASIVESSLNEAVNACFLREVRGWAFPTTWAPTVVGRFPFVFNGSADGGAPDASAIQQVLAPRNER